MGARHRHRGQHRCSVDTARIERDRIASHRRLWRASAPLAVGAALVAASVACGGPSRSHRSAARRGGLTPSDTVISGSTRPAPGPTEYAVNVPPGPAGPLTPGTCVGFTPANAAGAATVFLDPGHGGYDPGVAPRSSGLPTEKRLTLIIASEVRDRLVHDGYRVVMSRNSDTNVAAIKPGDVSGATETPDYLHRDLLARNECADASSASAVVGVHMDADTDPSAGGSETIYCAQRPFASSNLTLAELIQNDVVAAVRHSGFDLSSRGVRPDNNGVGGHGLTSSAQAYGHLVLLGPRSQPENPLPTTTPAALVEPLFLTNPAEDAYVDSSAGQATIAAGITDAVETFLPNQGRGATPSGLRLGHHPTS